MARKGTYTSYAAKKKAKQKWAIEKPKIDNARQLRGIHFTEPDDEEFKPIMKAARSKLEVPMPAAMPCKVPIKNSGETHRNIGKRKTKRACVIDANESTTPRLEGAGHKPLQDLITAKRDEFYDSLQSCSQVHSNASSIEDSRRKGSGERMGKTGENSGMSADESQKQNKGDRRSKEQGHKSSLRLTDGHMSSEKC